MVWDGLVLATVGQVVAIWPLRQPPRQLRGRALDHPPEPAVIQRSVPLPHGRSLHVPQTNPCSVRVRAGRRHRRHGRACRRSTNDSTDGPVIEALVPGRGRAARAAVRPAHQEGSRTATSSCTRRRARTARSRAATWSATASGSATATSASPSARDVKKSVRVLKRMTAPEQPGRWLHQLDRFRWRAERPAPGDRRLRVGRRPHRRRRWRRLPRQVPVRAARPGLPSAAAAIPPRRPRPSRTSAPPSCSRRAARASGPSAATSRRRAGLARQGPPCQSPRHA